MSIFDHLAGPVVGALAVVGVAAIVAVLLARRAWREFERGLR